MGFDTRHDGLFSRANCVFVLGMTTKAPLNGRRRDGPFIPKEGASGRGAAVPGEGRNLRHGSRLSHFGKCFSLFEKSISLRRVPGGKNSMVALQ
jgi:hypothetical protein